MPAIGDYLIIHAGFAINCLDAKNAEINLALMREMAEEMENLPGRDAT